MLLFIIVELVTLKKWRKQYKKPFLLQEGGADDDHGGKISISYHDTDRAIIRKYVWKWIMAKNQLIDIYQKQLADGYPDDYEPAGHNGFEDDEFPEWWYRPVRVDVEWTRVVCRVRSSGRE